jgi:hypothetical protein
MHRPVAEPSSSESLELELQQARARVQRLAAAIAAEEGALVRTALAEAEESAAAERAPTHNALRGPRPTEQRLRAQVTQAEQLLRQEHEKLKALLADSNVRLALAVEHGVDNYYTDVRTVRRRDNPAHGPAQATAQAGTALRRLNAERSRLADAVRSLDEEGEALAAERRAVDKVKRDLVDALRRRDGR